MRSKLLLLAVFILAGGIVPPSAQAQDSESRISAIVAALMEMRRGLPGKANLYIPPESRAPAAISHSEAVGAAQRLQFTVSEEPKGFAGHPADIQLMLDGATIGVDEAKVLVIRAVRQPSSGKLSGVEKTYAVDLSRVDGRWQVKKTYVYSVR